MKLTSMIAALGLSGAIALSACGSREGEGAEPRNEQPGTPAAEQTPVDPITGTPASTPTATTLTSLRSEKAARQYVEVTNLVVHSVPNRESIKPGKSGDYRVDFWVSDLNDPKTGLWVQKFYTDVGAGLAAADGTKYLPQVGDKVTIRGWYNSAAPFANITARRPYLRSENNDGGRPLQIEVFERGTGAVAPVEVPAGFGDAKGGTEVANADHAGALVHLSGDLQVTNATPPALARLGMDGATLGYNGFEITGGVLVNTQYTVKECDLAAEAAKEGAVVRFKNGVTGIWESYSFAQCKEGTDEDGPEGSKPFRCNKHGDGFIPGTELEQLYVLYPRSCADIEVVTAEPAPVEP